GAQPSRDLAVRRVPGGQQHDASPQHHPVRRRGPAGQGLKLSAVGIAEADDIGTGGRGLHRAAGLAGHDGHKAQPPHPTNTSLRQFGYVAGQLHDGTTLPLMRLRYADSASSWGFAIYRASHDDYEKSVLPSGYPFGTPQEALDCACGLYLGDTTAWLNPSP